MRLFVAVDPDDALRQRMLKAVSRIREQLDRRPGGRLAWVTPENWHITLVFLGEIRDDVATMIGERFGVPFDVPPFRLTCAQPGLFPPRGRPRVLWVGVEEGNAGLASLHRAVLERLDDVPFRREARTFTPHLTLARVRPGPPTVARDDLAGVHVGRPGGCTIDHVTLYWSQLSPKGARYEALVRAPLRIGS